MAGEPVIDATQGAPESAKKTTWWSWQIPNSWYAPIFFGAAFIFYLLGALDCMLVGVGLQGMNVYECTKTFNGIVYCDGPLSTNPPPNGMSVVEFVRY